MPYAPGREHVLGEHARHGHGQAGRGGQERGEGATCDQGAEQVAAEAADDAVRQQEYGGVGVAAEGQFGGVEAAEGAVDRGQEVEGADQAEDGDGGAAGGDAVRAGVEADDDVRQAHGAEEGGEDQSVRGVQRPFAAALGLRGRQVAARSAVAFGDVGALGEGETGAVLDAVGTGGEPDPVLVVGAAVDDAADGDGQGPVESEVEGVVDADDAAFAEGRRFVEGAAGGAVALPGEDQEEGGDQQGREFEPVLEGLHEGDAAHAAGGDDGDHDDGDDHSAEPVGRVRQHGQCQPGALQLRQQVQPAGAHDEGAREPSYGL